MNKLIDLRFVIGAFFAIVGILLLILGLTTTDDGSSINTWCGIIFVVFGGFMLALSFARDADDEIVE